jgi:hypothetical protein
MSDAMLTPRARASSISAGLTNQFPPTRRVRRFEMEDLYVDTGSLADLDGFANGFEQFAALIAHVAGVNAVIASGHLRQFDQFLRALKGRRRIDQRRGDAQAACFHCLLDMRFHLLELRGGGRCGAVSDDFDARLRGTVVRAEVHGYSLLRERVEVGGQGGGADRSAALASDCRGDALAQFVFGQAIAQQRFARLIHHIDPSR